tara:strand:+ start:1365 stop:3119 length:1755 start_codon:yes stop_codon:yes gene_type:complete
MPNEKDMSKCKCGICADEVKTGEPVYSVNEHNILCTECYAGLERCSACGDRNEQGTMEEVNDEKYCEPCFEMIRVCYSCDNTINTHRQSYCSYDGDTYCRNCAEDVNAYDCENCGESISINEYTNGEGEDYVNEWLCYPCWERKGSSEHISDFSSFNINSSVLDEHYWRGSPNSNESDRVAWAAHNNFFRQFYRWCVDEYDHNDFLLRKGALGYGSYGWFKTEAQISTSINDQFCDFLSTLIRDETLLTSHKRYGQVQPFADAFQKHTVFQITNDGWPIEDKERMWKYPLNDKKEALSFYVDYVARDELLECVKERKMPDGSALIKRVSKLIRANKDKIWERYSSYRQTWREYKTNSIMLKVPMSIGFDASVHEKVIDFNGEVGACQNTEYRETLGFNHISMTVNPHLYLLFYDPKDESRIIGRSVVRLWYKRSERTGLDKSTLYIMPSRLYLSKFTHAKNDFYAAMFKALNKWIPMIKQSLGVNEAILCAYKRTRHDTQSINDYLRQAKDKTITFAQSSDGEAHLASDWYYPIWKEKPNEEATWAYYADEYQSEQFALCQGGAGSNYAMRETYNGQLTYIGVN